jgi:hypothetical protein
MARLLSRVRLARAFLGFAVVAIPFAGSGGCNSRTACLQYTLDEYKKNNNSCLTPDQALQTFTDPSCPGPITSVDGPGTWDGVELCCYPVTYSDITPACGMGGSNAVTTVANGPIDVGPGTAEIAASGVTTGFAASGVTTGFAASTSINSAIASSGGGTCVPTCNQAILGGGMACGPGFNAYQQLRNCIGCDGADAGFDCSMQCNQVCSFFGPADGNCQMCLAQTSACFALFQQCEAQ